MERRRPLQLALFDLVQLLFHPRRVRLVEEIIEAGDEQIVHGRAQSGRMKTPFMFFDVLAIKNGRHDRRISRRPADALLFERLDERGFGVARRRLGEVLFRRDRVQG